MESGNVTKFYKKPQRPISIKFLDVVFKINTTGKGKNKSETKRTILTNISGIVKPGEMLAVLGPSGSGKTTLVTALAARRLSGAFSGSVTYNNKPFNSSIKRNIGFVAQQDQHYPYLTVSETLRYTALLRLPDTLSREEKVAMADEAVVSLGMMSCRDGVMGGGRVRGVSGGERKRVSIGQELLMNPSLLFLDEPTSGLDSTSAQRIVSMLRDMARNGRTVLLTIHQPSTRIFYMFDKMMLLADGNLMYFGKGSDAMTYFHSIGYAPVMAVNPSDFMLDLANGLSSQCSQSSTTVSSDAATLKNRLISAYRTTNKPLLMTEMIDHSISSIFDDANVGHSKTHTQGDDGWCTSWWEQFVTLLHRDMRNKRHETFSVLGVVETSLVTLLVGLVWFRSNNNMEDQTGLLFFLTCFLSLPCIIRAVVDFPLDRKMLEKERSSSMYRLSSYLAAKTARDVLMELILPTSSLTLIYWMCGLTSTFAIYMETLSINLLSVLVAQGFGLAIGSLVTDMEQAATLGSVLMTILMLFSGYYAKKIPAFMSWVEYVSFVYHTFRLNLIAQFSMRSAHLDPNVESLMAITEGGWSSSVIALFVMLFGFRFIAYFGFGRIGVTIFFLSI